MNWKSPLKRWSWKLARIVAAVYLVLALVMSFFQTQLIFPGAATQDGQTAEDVHGEVVVELLARLNDLRDNGQDELYRDGIHLATYRDAEELIDKIGFYLAREELRERIAALLAPRRPER